jgi:hypothetical protein
MSSAPTLAPDAAMVLGIASTALPFARTPDAEAERWLRVLRLHGRVGVALQALGVSEDSLAPEEDQAADGPRESGEPPRHDAVTRIAADAAGIARRRGAPGVATTDLLMAVMRVYGPAFDRVLRAHGTDRPEVLARLGVEMPAAD